MKALTGTVAVSGTILFIILGATTFSQVLSFSGATNGIVALVSGQGLSATAIIIGMMLILLFLGCFVDQVSMMLITLPFFMPLVQRLGVDPIWFGVLFLICMQLGLLTPPFGLLLFTMKGVAPPGITMQQIYAASVPYIVFGAAGAGRDLPVSADRHVAAGRAGELASLLGSEHHRFCYSRHRLLHRRNRRIQRRAGIVRVRGLAQAASCAAPSGRCDSAGSSAISVSKRARPRSWVSP